MLKQLLRDAKNLITQTNGTGADLVLLNAIKVIENSGLANAGLGCNLTAQGTAELDSSFAGI